jgi:hypothetical protein
MLDMVSIPREFDEYDFPMFPEIRRIDETDEQFLKRVRVNIPSCYLNSNNYLQTNELREEHEVIKKQDRETDALERQLEVISAYARKLETAYFVFA